MAYSLDPVVPDEVTLEGVFVSSGRAWAHVLKGLESPWGGGGAGPTSTQLLSTVVTDYQGALNTWQSVMTTDIKLTGVRVRQLTGIKSTYGSAYQVSIPVLGGVPGVPLIVSPGSGYKSGTLTVPLVDLTGGGTGGSLVLTFAGGGLTGIALTGAGVGYTKPSCPIVMPQNVPTNKVNKWEFMHGSEDFALGLSILGNVATDREVSFAAYSARLRSSLPGRFGRSSAHLPGVPEASTLHDTLTGPSVVTLNFVLNAWFLTAFVAVGPPAMNWTPQTISPSYAASRGDLTLAGITVATAPISTAQINPNVGSMLRRKLRI